MTSGSRPIALSVAAMLLFAGQFLATRTDAAFLYKNYVVLKDQGRDVLCDPYIVREKDYLYKIFRRKGEIAEENFPQFAQLFKRLNPHIKDIDHILPGQSVHIPLKFLEKDTFSEQTSGVVTIPYVTVSKLRDRLAPHLSAYEIKSGDTVSRIVSDRYGALGSHRYRRGMTLFQAANPDITDLDRIYAGQRIYLVDPALLDRPEMPPPEPSAPRTSDEEPQPAPHTAPEAMSVFERIGSFLDATFQRRGVYYFPNPAGEPIVVDLDEHPMVTLGDRRLMLGADSLDDDQKAAIQRHWPDVEMLTTAPDNHVGLLNLLHTARGGIRLHKIVVKDGGIKLEVHARWIFSRGGSGDYVCINMLGASDEPTPRSLVAYLRTRGVELAEVPATVPWDTAADRSGPSPAPTPETTVTFVSENRPEEWVPDFVESLGYRFVEDADITFTYGGIQVSTRAHMVVKPDRIPVVVDFGTFYGEAAQALTDQGFSVVQIAHGMAPERVVRHLLLALEASFDTDPAFRAARRSSAFNTFVHIPGIWVTGGSGHPVLFPAEPPDPLLLKFLEDRRIPVMLPERAGRGKPVFKKIPHAGADDRTDKTP